MKIDNEFTVGVPIERAWEMLTDLEGIAPCLPGAQLTGVDGDVYSGKVKIKVGPVVSDYAGTARFAEKDDAAYRAVIDAKGKDSRGAGNAAAMIRAQLRSDGPRTVVTVNTDLNISGKIAQFGSGMIKEVSAKLLGQFVENLEAKLLVPADEAAAVGEDAAETSGSDPVSPNSISPEPVSPEPRHRVIEAAEEADPLDLMSLARGSMAKRLLPLAGAAVVALIVYVIVRQ
jgi:carbon monoxide dehydrogenase subunit G